MNKPKVLTIDEFLNFNLNNSAIWTLSLFDSLVREKFSIPVFIYPDKPKETLDTLIVIGGGTIIDFAKIWRAEHSPRTKLVAIPSIWGSGAENSPVAILNEGTKKVIKIGEEFLPDFRLIWQELTNSLTSEIIKYACGDVWAHALEGFLSPVASDELRSELAELIKKLLVMPIDNKMEWFELSAIACSCQARSSVGLIHGIAHNTEGLLKQKYPNKYFGHAQICTTYLWPVLNFNMQSGDKVQKLFSKYNIELKQIIDILKYFFDEDLYNLSVEILKENWMTIIRDALTRTNCALVRPDDFSYFVERRFHEQASV